MFQIDKLYHYFFYTDMACNIQTLPIFWPVKRFKLQQLKKI